MLPTVLRERMSTVIIFVITMVTRHVEIATLIQKVSLLRKFDEVSVFTIVFPLQIHVSVILH